MSLIKKGEKIFGSDDVSILGTKAYFQGTLDIKGSVRIDGKLKGNITNCKSVIIGKEGTVTGDISAETISVSGSINGNIKAGKFVEFLAKSKVTGNVNAAKILVEEGAYFDGKCSMISSEEVKAQAATETKAEYAQAK